jgi:hypothetical protein
VTAADPADVVHHLPDALLEVEADRVGCRRGAARRTGRCR